jgi:hypothetical protein
MELDRRGAELLFQVFTEREERSAIVDRLSFAGQIIETGTTSYRLAHARAARRNNLADRGPDPA